MTTDTNKLREEFKQILRKVRWGDYQKKDGNWGYGIANQDEIIEAGMALIESQVREAVIKALIDTRYSVHQNQNKGAGNMRKGFNTAVRYYQENIDARLDELLTVDDEVRLHNTVGENYQKWFTERLAELQASQKEAK